MNKETMIACLKEVRAEMTWKKIACIILGAAICTFGVHNIHQRVEITEGGIIGLMLLIEHWLGIPSACLLYTSPSPRDRTRSRMPSSA